MAPGEFDQELRYVEHRCKELEIPSPTAFAYPAYVHTPSALQTLRERGYRFARAGDSRPYDPKVDDPLLIPSFSTTGTDENSAMRVMSALRLARDGKIVVLTIHGVPDGAHPQVTTSPELFERYLKFLADEKYTVLAMRDLAKYVAPAQRLADTSIARYSARLEKRPDAAKWREYFEKSDRLRAEQIAALDEEVKSAGAKEAVRAPSGGDTKFDLRNPPGGSLSSAEAKEFCSVVMSFQLPSGGWSKAVSYTKGARKAGMQWTSQETPWHYAATIDNKATITELRILAACHAAEASAPLKAAISRGVDYLLNAQFPNGGWPQNYPLEGGYHDFVTLNDSAMMNVLALLSDVAGAREGFECVDVDQKERARLAVERGNECLLKLQRNGGVWCAQYEPTSLVPAHARLFEPASLSGGESVEVVRYLMKLPKTPERTKAIEGAITWFSNAKTFAPEKPDGPLQWARFYELKTQKPIFPGKTDGRFYDTYEALREKNPGGYDYLVTKPADLIGKWAERWRSEK
jgi:PelA/Pel-15E family pectate lyase